MSGVLPRGRTGHETCREVIAPSHNQTPPALFILDGGFIFLSETVQQLKIVNQAQINKTIASRIVVDIRLVNTEKMNRLYVQR